jgi:hypothetical protein
MNRPHSKPGDGDGAKEIPFEVLPPIAAKQEALMRIVATVMDDLLKIPGTKWRVGLDPIIGLIPGLGDAASGMVSAMAVFYAARGGLPKTVLARMGLNIVVNSLFGAIPVFGDVLSFWFKSNRRNYALLAANAGRRKAKPADTVFVIAMLVVILIVMLTIAVGIAFVWLQIARALFGPGTGS